MSATARATLPVPEERTVQAPALSIVIPAKDAARTLPETLASVRALETPRPIEVIVVDDGSGDATAELARQAGSTVIPCEGRGVSAARNTGARHARGDVLMFVDADVILPRDAAERVLSRILDEGHTAVTGRLSAAHRHDGFASQYKNLWMAYTYERLPDEVSLFYTSAAAIRRDVFLELGGFTWSFDAPSVEDTALGHQLSDRGRWVRADKDLAVEHLRSYRLGEVLAVDYRRSRDLTRLFLSRGFGRVGRNTSSVPTSFMASLPMALLFFALGLAAAVAASPMLLALGLASLVFFFGTNASFLTYLLRHRGFAFFLKGHLFLPLDAMSVCAGILAGALPALMRRRG